MIAITGPALSRPAEILALAVCALSAAVAVVVPALYVVVLAGACAAVAVLAPRGRRVVAALAVWLPITTAVLVGTGLPA